MPDVTAMLSKRCVYVCAQGIHVRVHAEGTGSLRGGDGANRHLLDKTVSKLVSL